MKILVIGAGAIGSLVGGKLALAGEEVTLAGRPRFAAAVQARGLHLIDETGERSITTIVATASIGEAVAIRPEPFDLAIFTVKSYDTATALAELAAASDAQHRPVRSLLSVQNGVGNEEALAAAFPVTPVIAGSITTPVSVPDVATIRIDKPRYHLSLAPWRPAVAGPEFAAARAALARAGFSAEFYAGAAGMKWTKLLMNMVGNATPAILGLPPDQLFADPAIVDIEIKAWREALAVMAAAGIAPVNMAQYPFRWLAPVIRLAPSAWIRPLLRKSVGGARGGKLPSFLLDIQAGKAQNEVGWLNGAVAALGAQTGVATPVNRRLTELVMAVAANPAERAAWQGDRHRLATLFQ
jgi:2-dehydropantoate 2-reductase